MANCENCKRKIKYNQYKRWKNKVLCQECYKNRNKKVTEQASIKNIITEPDNLVPFGGLAITEKEE